MLRAYQSELVHKALPILITKKIVYLAMEMRVGKTLIALALAQEVDATKVLFVTKKKAISSIQKDFARENFKYDLTIINYEQLHKFVNNSYDVVVVDEAHSLGAFPKPSLRTTMLKKIVGDAYLILLSGTPTPESYSQIFHQFYISKHTPFQHKNFYQWSKQFVVVKQRNIRGVMINDYSSAKQDAIEQITKPYFLTFTRNEAGFQIAEVHEEIRYIAINPHIYNLAAKLVKERMHVFQDGKVIIADQPATLQTKIHQIFSGTVICEDDTSKILDYSKAKYIKENYQGKKIAIFYKFKAERQALIEILKEEITEDIDAFKGQKRVFISQIQSGSMGVDLSVADYLIFYNIDFSAVQYWQAKARIQTLHRKKPAIVHWLFARGGIEEKIYKVVIKKKDYNYYYFSRDYAVEGKKIAKANNSIPA